MKKILISIFVVLLVLMSCSCSDVYEQTVIDDVESYNSIWNLPERRASEVSVLFPQTITKESCISFRCEHTTYQLVGTGWQVELVLQYDDESFNKEIKRLNAICDGKIVSGTSQYFNDNAFASVWNWNSCFEYAVVGNNTVSYVYLQLINKDELTINEKLVPHSYEMNMSDCESYSLYSY